MTPYFEDRNVRLYLGNSLKILRELPEKSVQCVVTSPPYYGHRQYSTIRWVGGDPNCDHIADPSATKVFSNPEFNKNRPSREATKMPGYYADVCPKCGARRVDEQIGNEETLDEYIDNLVAIFREVRRVLRDDGILWLNLGDSYSSGGRETRDSSLVSGSGLTNRSAGLDRSTPDWAKPKDLLLVPFRVAIALQSDGWYLRSAIPWIKLNPMPGSQNDRPTNSTEYVFLLAKSERYFFDMEAVKRPTAESSMARAKRAVSTSHKNLNGAPGQTPHTLARSREHGEGKEDSMRVLREYDFFLDSLQYILDGGQMLLCDDDPLAFVVNVRGYRGKHYATMPQLLADICVKAGTSAVGQCPKCGAPWERVVVRKTAVINRSDRGEAIFGNSHSTAASGTMVSAPESTTIGWRPTCDCNPGWRDIDYLGVDEVQALLLSGSEFKPVPQIVLDPFSGVATTGLAALEQGRAYVGVDLGEDYLKQSVRRLRRAISEQPLFNTGTYV